MAHTRQRWDSGAERQLNWSRQYLRREKRGRMVRRVACILILAVLLAVGVYAATVPEGLAWTAFAPSPSSGTSEPGGADASGTGSVPDSVSVPVSSEVRGAGMCVVTFDARGGTMADAAASVAYGACVSEPAPPERAGYLFGGWYSDVARTRAWDFAKNAVLEDVTLYARWELAETDILPETGVTENASFWAGAVVVALALAAVLALLLRRLWQE